MRKYNKVILLLLTLCLMLPSTVLGATDYGSQSVFESKGKKEVSKMIKMLKKLAKNNGTNKLPRVNYYNGKQMPPEGIYPGWLDNSSFTQWVYEKYFSIKLPRTVESQYVESLRSNQAIRVSKKDLQPGDLIFFGDLRNCTYACESTKYLTHVGIYIGDDLFVDNSITWRGVAINSLNGRYAPFYLEAIRLKKVGK